LERAQKESEIKDLSDKFARAKASFMVDFKGLTVQQVTNLRKQLYPVKSEMRVVRNTLALRALANHPKSESIYKDSLSGTNAFIFAFEEAAGPAKTLSNFAKTNDKLQIKIGEMDGASLSEQSIKYLATLPSKDVLRAMLLGTFQAPMAKFLGTLQAPASSFVRVLAAHKEKLAPVAE
jgi:large subunit ribosomal protein L10